MAAPDSLKRLGGGRWETRDGRFAIEPQSGTWVIVDNTQTDELGLPLVRGPFGSLTAAREAIEGFRTSGPAESPLAERLKAAKAAGGRSGRAGRTKGAPSADEGAPDRGKRSGAVAPEAPPEPPPEPKWLRDLDPPDRRRARELIERLEKRDVEASEEIARSEIARNQPAVAKLAIERGLREAVAQARSPEGGARAAIRVLLGGRDAELGVRWRLVDDHGRLIDELDLPE
jgi:hypothetical protein